MGIGPSERGRKKDHMARSHGLFENVRLIWWRCLARGRLVLTMFSFSPTPLDGSASIRVLGSLLDAMAHFGARFLRGPKLLGLVSLPHSTVHLAHLNLGFGMKPVGAWDPLSQSPRPSFVSAVVHASGHEFSELGNEVEGCSSCAKQGRFYVRGLKKRRFAVDRPPTMRRLPASFGLSAEGPEQLHFEPQI
jgi:hypothetical protein